MIEEKVQIRTPNNEQLVGLTLKPNLEDQFPGVVFCHDFKDNKDGKWNRRLLGKLVGENMVATSFDFSGHGESGGKLKDTTFIKWLTDLKTVMAFFETLPQVDKRRIAVIGKGMGATVAMMFASEDIRVKSLVLMSVISHISHRKESVPEERDIWRKKEYRDFTTSTDGRKVRLKPTELDDLGDRDIIYAARKISCPVLLLHGGQDDKVRTKESLDLFDELREPKKLEVIPGADHEISRQENQDRVITIVSKWFNEYLKK